MSQPAPLVRSAPVGYLVAASLVLGATALRWSLGSLFDRAHVGLVYLLAVAATAAICGTRYALAAALLSFLAWNFFFLPPHMTLVLEDPRDWMLLVVFLVIALLVGQMTGALRSREVEACEREAETAALYRSSLAVATETATDQGLPLLLREVLANTSAEGCAVLHSDAEGRSRLLASLGSVDSLSAPEAVEIVRWVKERATAVGLRPPAEGDLAAEAPWPSSVTVEEVVQGASRGDMFLPLLHGTRKLGVLYVAYPVEATPGAVEQRLVAALASHVATFLERQRLLDEAREVASRQETERLKGVLFSSLSHNLKTPLASLKATLSSLRGKDVQWEPDSLSESLDLMAEDLEHLAEHIEKLLSLAQLESGLWSPRREWVELGEIISTARCHVSGADARRVRVERNLPDPFVFVDLLQMSQVIRHLLENALAYSPADAPVHVGAHVSERGMEILVDDGGAGIPEEDSERVFRKFFRGRAALSRGIQGTGLGLAICREIVSAHGGSVLVERSPAGGARLRVSLPPDVVSKKEVVIDEDRSDDPGG